MRRYSGNDSVKLSMTSAHVPITSVTYGGRTVLQLYIHLGKCEVRRDDGHFLVFRFGIKEWYDPTRNAIWPNHKDCLLLNDDLSSNKLNTSLCILA